MILLWLNWTYRNLSHYLLFCLVITPKILHYLYKQEFVLIMPHLL